ncbi:hypothetical protein [Lentilactobacillus kosonis]|uniref:SnoaL-like domain-containing protein n=1 Tax=Lentilactobacillus kosonis TaxID=2810561 RepID=A0A401FHR7_9LACO|nr:hypothetical protein [Lentilactobacillus kosonis]GAY71920.1 hypothetical protein NBRC111893_66 [Lentilactobacillus kosonis]
MGNSEDLLTIMQMITQADQLASQKDAKRYVALFSDDGAIEGTQGSAIGHEELKTWSKMFGTRKDIHFI